MCFKIFGNNNSGITESGVERPSPSDIIADDGIGVAGALVTVNLLKLNVKLDYIPRVWIPDIPDTNSMDGVFDYGNNNILIAGINESDHKKLLDFIGIGDIAVYREGDMLIIHRIINIGTDSQGKFFTFKGDNNTVEDPYIIRENQIEWVSVGTIY